MAKSLGQCTWVTSLADWLAEIGIGLNTPGSPEPTGNPSILSLVGEADVESREWASCRGVGCLAEVHMEGDSCELIPGLEWVETHAPAPKACIPIRVGQVWSFANHVGRLYEILGLSEGDQVSVILWRDLSTCLKFFEFK